MGRPTSRKKSPIAKAIAELRARLGETQASMAVKLGVSLQSIARWETEAAPHHMHLTRLWLLAREHGYKDLMKVFYGRINQLQAPDQRKVEAQRAQYDRWGKIQNTVIDVMQEAQQLSKEGHPAAPRLADLASKLISLTRAAREWSWGNL